MNISKKLSVVLSLMLFISLQIKAAPDSVSVDTIDNYQGWGWDTILVVKNNFITLGIVPSIGGRVLQYDLEADTFMITNPSLYGDLFHNPASPTTPYSGNWGYGGYKTWPAPQDEWNWPPPPTLAWGNYEFEVFQTSKDSVMIRMKGQKETVRTPDLRFDRYITVYANSTRIKVVTVLFNDAPGEQEWAIWDVTQTITQHESKEDYTNFSVYFPLESEDDVWHGSLGDIPARDFILPGIYKVQYSGAEGKIFAVASDGWACFTDERDSQTYAKIFDIIDGAEYSDGGAMVHVYTSGSNEYFEVEALGPLETIGANGDSIVFVEDWYVAGTGGPFYYAGHEGIIKEHLQYDTESENLSGEFSSFVEGEYRIIFLDEEESQLGSGSVFVTEPTAATHIDENVTLPESTRYIEILAYDYSDNLIGILDRVDIEQAPPESNEGFTCSKSVTIFPVPAKDFISVQLDENVRGNYQIRILAATGQVVFSAECNGNRSESTIPVGDLPQGLYFIEITGTDFRIMDQIIKQ
ncbi:MAG: T9SS type A sorting domain-containing protein [Bacteroidales bacterium]|nr:T9SS type A sorting domain-containing protein [Bacteroidales bacterium]